MVSRGASEEEEEEEEEEEVVFFNADFLVGRLGSTDQWDVLYVGLNILILAALQNWGQGGVRSTRDRTR